MLNTHSLDMIFQVKYMPIVMNPARIAWLKILEMLWSELRLILKTSSVTPDFFYFFFYRILSFSTVSQSLKKSVCGKFLGANVLKCISASTFPTSKRTLYMKNLLDSDWLRTVQFFLNTVLKRGNWMQKRKYSKHSDWSMNNEVHRFKNGVIVVRRWHSW